MRGRIAEVLSIAGMVGLTFLLAGNVYNAVVEMPNMKDAAHVEALRAFATEANPGNYFRVISPISSLCLLASAIVGWSRPRARNAPALVAAGCMIAAEVFTVAYFFPRNDVMFVAPLGDGAAAVQAAAEWSRANLLRMAICGVGLLAAIRVVRTPTAAAAADRALVTAAPQAMS
jgi:uncharacterized membrane protein